MNKEEIFGILKDKRFQWAVALIILFVIIFWSSSIRLSNWDLLTDQTTGEKIPLALDPFYFLRLSETVLEQGSLPEFDEMRYNGLANFGGEITQHATVFLYKAISPLGYTLREVNIMSPVIYYFISMIFFFFLCYALTSSKFGAVVSSGILAFIPAYLYRTMGGFSDHESIGMLAFFSCMLFFVYALQYLEKEKFKTGKTVGYGLIVGLLSAFTIVSWGGIASILYMLIPLAFLILWLVKTQRETNKDFLKEGILFYFVWIVSGVIFGNLMGMSISLLISRFVGSTTGLISLFVLGFVIVDFALMAYRPRWKNYKEKYRQLYSFAGVIVLGVIFLMAMGKSIISMVSGIWLKLLHPFGVGRTGSTIAENAQPYLVDWIAQAGKPMFWIFVGGLIILGYEISRGVRGRKNKLYLSFGWAFLVFGILFSRISSDSLFNGTNFASQTLYMIGALLFAYAFIYVYLKKDLKMSVNEIIILSWAFLMIISGRAAVRMFFAIMPFMAFMSGYFLVKLYGLIKNG